MRRVAVVLLALWPAVAGAELRARTRDLGAASPVVGLDAWDKGGSADWGAGIPSPTIDCAAVGTSSAASLQCSGATPSFAGSAQTAAGSPWWYRGDTAVRPAIALNGSTDWWGLGDVADAPSRLAVCVDYEMAGSTYRILVGKGAFPGAAGQSWSIYMATAGSLLFYVSKAGPVASSISNGSVASGYAVTCVAYEYVADGTSVMRGNTNGTAWVGRTDAVGPIQSVAGQTTIGASAVLGSYWDKSVRRVAIWTGADAPTSAAQLAQMVATQQGLAADRPAGAYSPIARTDSTLCCPFSDAECYTVGPGAPCIHAPSYSGWAGVGPGIEVYGAGANAALQSQNLSAMWNANGGSITPDASNFVDGSPTMDRFTTNRVNGPAYQLVAVASSVGPFTFSSWSRAPTGTVNASVSVACASGTRATCACGASSGPCTISTTGTNDCSAYGAATAAAPTRLWVTLTCSTANTGVYLGVQGGRIDTDAGVAADFGGMQLTPTAYPVPYRPTTGTAYAGIASTATTLTMPVALTDPTRWAISWTGAPTGAWQSARGVWLLGTNGAANSASQYYTTGLAVIRATGSGDAYWQYTAPATSGDTRTLLTEFASGAATLRDGGNPVALTFAGAPVGAWTLPSTLTVGTVASQFNGLVSRVAQCRKAGGCK